MSKPAEIQVTPEQWQKIRLLSDGEIYEAACKFIQDNGTIDSNKQAVSLVAYTQSWEELDNYVNRQAGRDWSVQTRYAGYKEFFVALKLRLNTLKTEVENNWFPPGPEYDTKAKRRDWVSQFAILVAREFLQHLEAENFYKS